MALAALAAVAAQAAAPAGGGTQRNVTLAAVQMSMVPSSEANIVTAERLVREAARRGAQVILLPELFELQYFPKDDSFTVGQSYRLARTVGNSTVLQRMSALARELAVVLPVSFYERKGQAYYNAVAIIDADGSILGVYRKSHIPTGPGYQEKFFFSPGDTGFKAWDTRYVRLGVGICWDQWFPESARVMALKGAEVLMYPTAIGGDACNEEPNPRTIKHWQRVMQGHAAANFMPVVASNRYGAEASPKCNMTFYGSSFIAGGDGDIVEEAPTAAEELLLRTVDLAAAESERALWGVFRDRRPELYAPLLTLDGEQEAPTCAAGR